MPMFGHNGTKGARKGVALDSGGNYIVYVRLCMYVYTLVKEAGCKGECRRSEGRKYT